MNCLDSVSKARLKASVPKVLSNVSWDQDRVSGMMLEDSMSEEPPKSNCDLDYVAEVLLKFKGDQAVQDSAANVNSSPM